jgi:hypothetical protein
VRFKITSRPPGVSTGRPKLGEASGNPAKVKGNPSFNLSRRLTEDGNLPDDELGDGQPTSFIFLRSTKPEKVQGDATLQSAFQLRLVAVSYLSLNNYVNLKFNCEIFLL